ncbi:MAG: serine protease [Desulfobacteraceae bacterium]|nr:serine protease [Desulfobacteraceae bacterium]
MSEQYILPLVLQIIGVVIIIAEIILPSGGVLSILAIGTLGFSLFKAFSISSNIGILFLGADIIIVPALVLVGLKFIAKSPVTLRKTLSKKDGVVSQKKEQDQLLDASGIAVTDLRPAGAIKINNKKIDAVTQGEYIDRGASVRVIQVTGNQVIVKEE